MIERAGDAEQTEQTERTERDQESFRPFRSNLKAMNFEEATKYLYSLGNETLAMKLGLESVRALACVSDDPQKRFPAVHIAGTNGKGSTAAMTANILRAA